MGQDPSVGEALAAFRAANGIPADGGSTWTCRLGALTLRMPNFGWRRRAIARHDLHHIVTGYPCTLRGECRMAAWEFAAGRFPHPAATLFCLPLVILGLLWSPRAIWSAFLAGRRSESLYRFELTEDLLRAPLHQLCRERSEEDGSKGRFGDSLAFGLLVAQAGLLLLAPAILAAAVLLAL